MDYIFNCMQQACSGPLSTVNDFPEPVLKNGKNFRRPSDFKRHRLLWPPSPLPFVKRGGRGGAITKRNRGGVGGGHLF